MMGAEQMKLMWRGFGRVALVACQHCRRETGGLDGLHRSRGSGLGEGLYPSISSRSAGGTSMWERFLSHCVSAHRWRCRVVWAKHVRSVRAEHSGKHNMLLGQTVTKLLHKPVGSSSRLHGFPVGSPPTVRCFPVVLRYGSESS